MALERAVASIFADEGLAGLGRALFRHAEWASGVTTRSFLLTLGDYLGDLQEWLDGPFFRRAVAVRLRGPPFAATTSEGARLQRLGRSFAL
jgi:hypothetical protein